MTADYTGVVIFLALAGGLTLVALALPRWLAPQAKHDPQGPPGSQDSGEAKRGVPMKPEGEVDPQRPPTQHRFGVRFYLLALLFLAVNVQFVFVFAWGVAFRELGWGGAIAAVGLVLPLLIGVVYEWRKGGLAP